MAISTELEGLVKEFEKEYASAKGANLKRYGEAKGIYDQVIGLFKPGGAFDIGTEADIDRARTKSVAQGAQALVDTGLYPTTQTAGLTKKFEEEAALPHRGRQTQYRVGQQAEAMRGKAGVIERREDPYPDMDLIAQLVAQASSAPQQISDAPKLRQPANIQRVYEESSGWANHPILGDRARAQSVAFFGS